MIKRDKTTLKIQKKKITQLNILQIHFFFKSPLFNCILLPRLLRTDCRKNLAHHLLIAHQLRIAFTFWSSEKSTKERYLDKWENYMKFKCHCHTWNFVGIFQVYSFACHLLPGLTLSHTCRTESRLPIFHTLQHSMPDSLQETFANLFPSIKTHYRFLYYWSPRFINPSPFYGALFWC